LDEPLELASLPNSQVRWAEVARVIRGMRERGLLEPRDLPNLAEAERRARQEPIRYIADCSIARTARTRLAQHIAT
jgi:hypothetical protein